jgi:hypothetical protein
MTKKTLEANCRPASPLDAGRQFRGALCLGVPVAE